MFVFFFFFKQKTAYEMRISDWSSDVCSSDLLGEALDIPELGELAASAALAGSEGARVRTSLSAKARSLRLRGLTDVEAAAQSASELMSLPVVLLMFGFVIFLGYPAVDRVLQGI